MLKQRVITALVLTIVVLAELFTQAATYFPYFVALIVLLGAWEWANLANAGKPWQRALYVFAMALALVVAGYALDLYASNFQGLNPLMVKPLLILGCCWWALALLLVQGYPTSAILWGAPLTRLLMGFLVLVPTWVALIYMRFQPQGAWLVLILLGVVATADIGGYFAGRRFGKRKLAAAVSPGKTLEGFAGGLLSNVLLAMLIAYFSASNLWLLLAIIMPTSLFSVLGDLLESMLKRHVGAKDSGTILPGHGGILDRVDSITAAAPVFALALLASGWNLG